MKSFDIDVEKTILGDLLTFDSIRREILAFEEQDFAFDDHKNLFLVMKNLYNKDGNFDYLSVSANSKSDVKQLLSDCISCAITVTTFSEHKKLLKEMASVRRLENGIEKLRYNGSLSLVELENLLNNERLEKLCNDFKKQNCENAANFVTSVVKKEELLKTGFSGLDYTLGGLRKGTLFTVGARPSVGKTSFAVNIANNVYSSGKKVMFFSLEMSSNMIYERFFANYFNVDYSKFIRKELELETLKKIGDTLNETKERLFILDDIYNVENICNAIMEEKPDLAVIDFVQIISTTQKFSDMRLKIDYISYMLKRTAKTTGTVIMVLSQLSRSGKEAPTMSDLKESGGLEQDGDYIVLLHRPYVLKKDVEIPPGKTEVLVDKNKFGRTGKIDMIFDLNRQSFSEIYD